MLWACEQNAPADPVWSDFEKSVQMLLLKLKEALQNDTLRHYFIPEINLLAQTGQDVKQKSLKIIENLIGNIFMAAPFDMDEKREFVGWVCSSLENSRKILAPLDKGYFSRQWYLDLLASQRQDLDLIRKMQLAELLFRGGLMK